MISIERILLVLGSLIIGYGLLDIVFRLFTKSNDRFAVSWANRYYPCEFNSVAAAVASTLANVLQETDFSPESKLVDDMKIDGMDLVEIVLALETDLGCMITDHEAMNWILVSDIISCLVSKMNSYH
ncbi:MAG: hypothetical protein HC921_12885 [Synechococcaceae cyanobacterium SM2_3_1]|nr:hypothetical protein [Synechococcaceae cyanobacterium SM2_3_1]